MTASRPDLGPTFVLRSVWHIVRSGPLEGPVVGAFYVFKCYRWAAASNVQGVAYGRPTGSEVGICDRCKEVERTDVAGVTADLHRDAGLDVDRDG